MIPSATSRLLARSQATDSDTGHSLALASPAAPLVSGGQFNASHGITGRAIIGVSRKRCKGSKFDSMASERIGACHIEKITEDAILCEILSHLTARDVLRTSVLSSRWRHVWEYVPNLHFDSLKVLGIYDFQVIDNKVRNVEKFICFLNGFMKHHRGIGVEKFIIDFPLNKKHADHLNKWVDFGVASGAKDFRLILREENLHCTERYDFPCQLFASGRGSSIKLLCLAYVTLKLPEHFDGFASLKEIDLDHMVMNEGDIRNLMCSCPLLESLGISWCWDLVTLNISHPPSLKYLKVINCLSLEWIELSAENLISFIYTGQEWIDVSFKNTPRLTSILFKFQNYSDTAYYALCSLPVDLPQIEYLSLHADSEFKVSDLPENHKTFTQLKHLVLSFAGPEADHLFWLTALLYAAPFLEKLEFHLLWSPLTDKRKRGAKEREMVGPSKYRHEHLKMVEITGFTGMAIHMEIATYLLNNTTRLELMTINGRKECFIHGGELEVKGKSCLPDKIREMVCLLQKKNLHCPDYELVILLVHIQCVIIFQYVSLFIFDYCTFRVSLFFNLHPYLFLYQPCQDI